MYAKMDAPQSQSNYEYRGYQGDYRNKGIGGRFYNRGGWGRGRSYRDLDMLEITCFWCDKNWHFTTSCPYRLLKLQEVYEKKEKEDTHEADALMMHENVYRNEKNVKPQDFETGLNGDNVWYLDNGASNHMTGNWSYFNILNETIIRK